jgi:hypothetical protein
VQINIGEDKVDHEFRLQSRDRFLRRGSTLQAGAVIRTL